MDGPTERDPRGAGNRGSLVWVDHMPLRTVVSYCVTYTAGSFSNMHHSIFCPSRPRKRRSIDRLAGISIDSISSIGASPWRSLESSGSEDARSRRACSPRCGSPDFIGGNRWGDEQEEGEFPDGKLKNTSGSSSDPRIVWAVCISDKQDLGFDSSDKPQLSTAHIVSRSPLPFARCPPLGQSDGTRTPKKKIKASHGVIK